MPRIEQADNGAFARVDESTDRSRVKYAVFPAGVSQERPSEILTVARFSGQRDIPHGHYSIGWKTDFSPEQFLTLANDFLQKVNSNRFRTRLQRLKDLGVEPPKDGIIPNGIYASFNDGDIEEQGLRKLMEIPGPDEILTLDTVVSRLHDEDPKLDINSGSLSIYVDSSDLSYHPTDELGSRAIGLDFPIEMADIAVDLLRRTASPQVPIDYLERAIREG